MPPPLTSHFRNHHNFILVNIRFLYDFFKLVVSIFALGIIFTFLLESVYYIRYCTCVLVDLRRPVPYYVFSRFLY